MLRRPFFLLLGGNAGFDGTVLELVFNVPRANGRPLAKLGCGLRSKRRAAHRGAAV
jgi:hypothetical protein